MYNHRSSRVKSGRSKIKFIAVFFLVVVIAVAGYTQLQSTETIEEKIEHRLSFDSSVSNAEQELISDEISKKLIDINQDYSVNVLTSSSSTDAQSAVLNAYVPVTSYGAVRQKVSAADLSSLNVVAPDTMSDTVRIALSEHLEVDLVAGDISSLGPDDVAFIAVGDMDSTHKLLEYNGSYYLDDFESGAEFRIAVFDGDDTSRFSSLELSSLPTSNDTYKVNMTGVTALTRIMQRKLATVGDPLYFSELIGDFLADADYTHVSNEVSFLENCSYSNTLFCSPPEFIETLKDSGVDLVELTGNHNNDRGAEANAATIELYRSLGWDTVGGGLNTEDARKPVIKTAKGSEVAFLAYNFPDSPNGGAIAGLERAGANSFDFTSITKDIASLKDQAKFIVVNVQYWECYAYPDGYVEFPECDKPIGEQETNFKKLIDLGADMVVGSSAHQPQTYELYNGKSIYYGLGNLYFDQTSWPGTERGIVLSHYFNQGELLQTKLTPTVYDRDLQPRVMTDSEAEYLLQRLSDAR